MKLFSVLYSSVFTFFGGPFAGVLFLYINYRNAGKVELSRKILIYGILLLLLIILLIYSVPSEYWLRTANLLIPVILAITMYFLTNLLQGDFLKNHKKSGGQFYRVIPSFLIAISGLLILGIVYFTATIIKPGNYDISSYDAGIEKIKQNEILALSVLDNSTYISVDEADKALQTSILLWEENLRIIEEISVIDDMPYELAEQNRLLRQYFEFRVMSYILMKKALNEDTNAYDEKIQEVNYQIDSILTEISNISFESN